ncbi:MAG: DNA mismatch endonuclease Vsr [Desulfuromonas sp.]|nr:DNA mismatch endonuclease Vsr [Desulfuromonas sp.]
MADVFTQAKRSWVMSRIAGKHTKPEKIVRKLLHSAGFRFRLHNRTLPGKPDIVLKKYKTVIFVNGCFWHQHSGCSRATAPSSNAEYWKNKLLNNVDRFEMQKYKLESLGWRVVVVWECETKRPDMLSVRLIEILRG